MQESQRTQGKEDQREERQRQDKQRGGTEGGETEGGATERIQTGKRDREWRDREGRDTGRYSHLPCLVWTSRRGGLSLLPNKPWCCSPEMWKRAHLRLIQFLKSHTSLDVTGTALSHPLCKLLFESFFWCLIFGSDIQQAFRLHDCLLSRPRSPTFFLFNALPWSRPFCPRIEQSLHTCGFVVKFWDYWENCNVKRDRENKQCILVQTKESVLKVWIHP